MGRWVDWGTGIHDGQQESNVQRRVAWRRRYVL